MSRTSRNRHPHECQYPGCKGRQVKVRYENHSTKIRSPYCPDHTCCYFPRCPEGKLSKHEFYCAKHGSCGISDCNTKAPTDIIICKWHDCSKEADPRNEFCDDHRDVVEREKLYPDPPVVLPAYVQERIPECVQEYPQDIVQECVVGGCTRGCAPANLYCARHVCQEEGCQREKARHQRRCLGHLDPRHLCRHFNCWARPKEGCSFCDAHVKEEPEACESWDIEFVYVFVTAVLLAVAVAFFYIEW